MSNNDFNPELVAEEIKAVLDKHNVVLGSRESSVELRLRPREDADPTWEFEVYDRTFYLPSNVNFLNEREQETFEKGTDYVKEKVKDWADSMPPNRLENAKIRMHMGYYDGPQSGIIELETGDLAYFFMSEDSSSFSPRVFYVSLMTDEEQALSVEYMDAMREAGWAQVVYDNDGNREGMFSGNTDNHPGKEGKFKDFKNSLIAKEKAPSTAWLTYADMGLYDSSRKSELDNRCELYQDWIIEQFDTGYMPKFP